MENQDKNVEEVSNLLKELKENLMQTKKEEEIEFIEKIRKYPINNAK